jgi:hypothetical protein
MTAQHKESAANNTAAGNRSVLVLFGTDENGKPRAAQFKEGQVGLALKAAGLMGLKALRPGSPEQVELVRKLPLGRLYANGNGLVPYVRRDLYQKLLELGGEAVEVPPASNPRGPAPTENDAGPRLALPRNWVEIEVGHVVIAQETPEGGWWEAVVIGKEGDALELRYRDYPKLKPFIRHRSTVALVDPNAA